MKGWKIAVVAVSLGLVGVSFAWPVGADIVEPRVSCSRPSRPFGTLTDSDLDRYEREVQRYSRCISEFIERQMEEAERHQRAIRKARQEWDRFVREELASPRQLCERAHRSR